MSGKAPSLVDWVLPMELEAAGNVFSQNNDTVETSAATNPPPVGPDFFSEEQVPKEEVFRGENPTFDPSLLLGILGSQVAEQTPALSPLLGLLGGEKPDILSFLPLLLPLLTAKKTAQPEQSVGDTEHPPPEPPPQPDKTIHLENYSVT